MPIDSEGYLIGFENIEHKIELNAENTIFNFDSKKLLQNNTTTIANTLNTDFKSLFKSISITFTSIFVLPFLSGILSIYLQTIRTFKKI